MLDVSDKNNYKWVTDFIPASIPPDSTSSFPGTSTSKAPASIPPISSSQSKNNLGAIIGGTVGSIVIIIGFIIFLIYYWERNRDIDYGIPTPG